MIFDKKFYHQHNFFKANYLRVRAVVGNILRYFGYHKMIGRYDTGRSGVFRGLPYLTVKEDGSLRCTSCRLCELHCPTKCIHIESRHGKDPRNPGEEGPPSLFRIEILRCTFCGFCVEACPVDAIRMSSEDCLSDHAGKNWSLDQKILAFRPTLNNSKGIVSVVEDKNRK